MNTLFDKIMKFTSKSFIRSAIVVTFFVVALISFFIPYPLDKYQYLQYVVYKSYLNYHYLSKEFDQFYAKRFFELFIDEIDPMHRFFLQQDINKLSKYINKIPKLIQKNNVEFFEQTYSIFIKRVENAQTYVEQIFKNSINIEKEEFLNIYTGNDNFYFKKEEDLKAYWAKLIKYDILLNLKSLEESNKDSLPFDTLFNRAKNNVLRNYKDFFDRIKKLNKDDYFQIYLNAMLNAFDIHTNYFAPKTKEDFNISLTGELEGIGATLSQQYGEIKVVDIVPGSPAWKSGMIEKGDVILSVAQEGNPPVSVTSMRLDDAVRLIRGKKGTKVTLTIKKIDGTIKDVELIRDKILIEETFMRSAIIKNANIKAAIIHIPSFYSVYEGKGRSCTRDFQNELAKINQDSINYLIIDLRNNGGGSLPEVVQMVGLLINRGPVVQVRSRNNEINILEDSDPRQYFNGEIIVLTNYFSASASEIMAAALQDYDRALIFGNSQTTGKGTVQSMLDLDQVANLYKPLGALKVTISKFYRINGNSTQLEGVKSDILFPSIYDSINITEKKLKYPLEHDEINKCAYTKYYFHFNKDSVVLNIQKNIWIDSISYLTSQYSKVLQAEEKERNIPLKYTDFKNYINQKNQKLKNLNDYIARKVNNTYNLTFLSSDQKAFEADTLVKNRYENWIKRYKNDYQLYYTLKIFEYINKFKK